MIKKKIVKLAVCAAVCATLSPGVSTSASILNLGDSFGNVGTIIPSKPPAMELTNYTFELDSTGVIEFIKKKNYNVPFNETVVIQSKQNDVTITGVGNGAFTISEGVKRVTFPEASQVFFIDRAAFYAARDLTTVDFTNSKVRSIGSYALANCNNLTTVRIPRTIDVIAENAFEDSPNLKDIYIDAKKGSVKGEPWGATNAKIHWLRG